MPSEYKPLHKLISPSKRAFEKYKPQGLFLEFYGNKQLTNLTCSGPYWGISALSRFCTYVLPRPRANIPQYGPRACYRFFTQPLLSPKWNSYQITGGKPEPCA